MTNNDSRDWEKKLESQGEDPGYRTSSAAYQPEPLSIQQINSAKVTIANNHPLSRIPLIKALPYCTICRCCLKRTKKDFRLALRKSLLKKMDMKMPKTDIKLEEDPFLRLGFGMNAYFEQLKYMMILMLILFLFSFPAMCIYGQYNALSTQYMYMFTRFSLGNMGGSESLCTSAPIESPYMPLSCTTGILRTEFAKFGIIPSTVPQKNICNDVESTKKCDGYLNSTLIQSYITAKCEGSQKCSLDILNEIAAKYLQHIDIDCYYDSDFYIQVPCMIPEEEKKERQVYGLFIGCIGVFIALFFTVFIDYMRSIFKNAYIEWDVKTITAGDYSVELEITEDMWYTFLNDHYDPNLGRSRLTQFRDYLQKELEDRLTNLPDLGYEEETPERINIAMLTFAFDNSELINQLKSRGNAIKYEKWDQMRLINKRIDELKTKNLEQYNRPVTAFLTFENEEGLNRCINYNETVMEDEAYVDYRTLLGEKLNIEEASEPTDIIWENRHYTAFDRFIRTTIVVIIVTILLSGSFVIIFQCSLASTKPLLKYPSINCQDVIESQGKFFGEHAFAEWDRNFDEDGSELEHVVYMGVLKCFCDIEMKKPGFSKSDTYEGKRFNETESDDWPICYTYISDTFYAKILGYSMSVIIVSINYILRTIMIGLIKWIGEDTHSKQFKSITNGVFITQFLNTGILLLIVQANLEEYEVPLSEEVFNGPFKDFLPLWYVGVGYKIVQTMIVAAIFPFIEFGIAFFKLWVFRVMDRGLRNKDTYKTKKTNMQTYIDIYSGPEYLIHFKYSGILNVTFVTMMYGIGQPILFPIAVVSFFILYSIERLLIAYFYQMPPSFDDKMTKNALNIMRYAAVFYLFFGYWQLSNYVIFQNYWQYVTDTTEKMHPGHFISLIKVDQASPMLLIGSAVLLIILMQTFFKKSLKAWGFSFGGVKLNVDENLPFFFTGLKLRDADWLLQEYNNLYENYGFEIINKGIADTLDTVGTPKKAIVGIPYYIILANPAYYRDFQYVCCDVPDRNQLIKDDDSDDENDCEQSDLVAILLNMGYIPEEVIGQFKFEAGFYKTFKPIMDEFLMKRGKSPTSSKGSSMSSDKKQKQKQKYEKPSANPIFDKIQRNILSLRDNKM